VLMDVQMPEMDGLTAARKIRESEQSTSFHLPIIAMTAHAMKGDRERCIAAGMDGYVSKPISSQLLREAIASVLSKGNEATKVSSSTAPQETGVPARLVFWDMGETLERLGGDEKLLHEVVEIFLEGAPRHLAGLRQAVAQGDAKTVEEKAHTLRGELGYLGISEIAQTARELEQMGQKSDLGGAADVYARLEARLTEVLTSMQQTAGAWPDMQTVSGGSGASQ
jgi:two-component system, sensor histidine kinase and response regulator